MRHEVGVQLYKLNQELSVPVGCVEKAWEEASTNADFVKNVPFLVLSYYDGAATVDDDNEALARFYKKIKYAEGLTYLALIRRTYLDDGKSYFMVFHEQTTDSQACKSYGSGAMADACFQWRKFHEKYPKWYVERNIEMSCEGLTQPDCVCGTSINDVRKELKAYLKLDSSSPDAKAIKELVGPGVLEGMGLRLSCRPG